MKEKKEEVNSVYIYDTLSKQYSCLCKKLIAKNQLGIWLKIELSTINIFYIIIVTNSF